MTRRAQAERALLQERVEELEAAIRSYLREVTNPAPDLTMRRIESERLAATIGWRL